MYCKRRCRRYFREYQGIGEYKSRLGLEIFAIDGVRKQSGQIIGVGDLPTRNRQNLLSSIDIL